MFFNEQNLRFYGIYYSASILHSTFPMSHRAPDILHSTVLILHSALFILHSAIILYRHIVLVIWSIKVFYGCMFMCPEKTAVKKAVVISTYLLRVLWYKKFNSCYCWNVEYFCVKHFIENLLRHTHHHYFCYY